MTLLLVRGQSAFSQDSFQLPPNPQVFDVGNLASDGTGGRQMIVRPLEPREVGLAWIFFPPHWQLPETFPDPTPATPAQRSVFLTEGTPLVLVIPQLAHFPSGATIGISDEFNDSNIGVHASIHYLNFVTATIYGPHEYLLPLGSLSQGVYHLTFDLTQSNEGSDQMTISNGYLNFVVNPVPEPATAILFGMGTIVILFVRWPKFVNTIKQSLRQVDCLSRS